MPLTVANLRKWLANLPDDMPVILAKDAEGNGFSPLEDRSRGMYAAESTFSGEHYMTEEERLAEDHPDDFTPVPDDAVLALFLWPTN